MICKQITEYGKLEQTNKHGLEKKTEGQLQKESENHKNSK